MNVFLNDLILEVTRWCNFACEHCCRGTRQQITLGGGIIKRIFSDPHLDGINTLTLSGGEPSLVPKTLSIVAESIALAPFPVDRFYIATNGSTASQAFMMALLHLSMVIENQDTPGDGGALVEVSHSIYHEAQGQSTEAIRRLHKLAFVQDRPPLCDVDIIEEGRGRSFHTGRHAKDYFDATLDDDLASIDADIYVNALGEVIVGCDFSYASQTSRSIGSLVDEDLSTILLRHAKA